MTPAVMEVFAAIGILSVLALSIYGLIAMLRND